jgi:3-(3-hydroxy-phenyl)propionate hydroxylase
VNAVPDRATVVVVGAGPTGITAATLLADQGVDCLVLDRWAGVYPRPRAVATDDEVHRIIARLGLAEGFAKISRPAKGLRLLEGSDHTVLAEFARPVQDGPHGFPESSLFDQPDLEELLRSGVASRPEITLRGEVDVTAVVPHVFEGDGAVSVEYVDRTTGTPGTVRADWVLGCDGANSLVRRTLGASMLDLGFSQQWLVVDLRTGTDLDQWEGIHQVASADRASTFMRIGPDRYRWEFQLRAGESSRDFDTVARLRPLLRPWLRGTPDDQLEIVRVTDYTFRAQVADRWSDGRVFLLGDAAHLTPPFIGQGMGAGLRDALNLAWKLAAVVRHQLPEGALRSYEAERRPHVTAMIRQAVQLGRIMTGGGRLKESLRRRLTPALTELPRVRRQAGDSATPALGRSRLRRSGLVGTLCPNALVAPGTRLDDVARGGFALVTDAPVDASRRRRADRSGIAVVDVRGDEPLARWLRAADVHTALVRPDGTVQSAR